MERKETIKGHIMPMHEEITSEDINKFFEGSDPMKHIISIELGYNDEEAEIVFVDDNGIKKIRKQDFKPFVWAKNSACIRMFDGNRKLLIKTMREYNISVKPLYTCREDYPYPNEKLDNGYKYLFYATKKMSMSKFQDFFKKAGTPINGTKKVDNNEPSSQEFMTLQPVELFMIQTGKRYFKGVDNYNDLKRMSFDLETEGLNPKIHHISQIGVRTNKGFEKIITIQGKTKEEKDENELKAIIEIVQIIKKEMPDVIFGHNSENFDWDFIIVRCQMHGVDFKELSGKILREGIYKKNKPTTLKLGGEVETFFQTIIKYHNVVDSLHAVRRAMATDSSFEKANLKYATQYLKLNKKNRVYVPGNIIESTWRITDPVYAFNDDNGDWYKITEEKPIKDGYEKVSGKYIVERYLLDDIWECDKVELALHETDFHLTKIMPTTFPRVCTMGTATQWKLIMLNWAYQHDLAAPSLGKNRKYTGGLSRLLSVGFCKGELKFDFAALYVTIMLTWNIESETDFTHVLLKMLMFVLVEREKYKFKKNDASKEAEKLYKQLLTMTKGTDEYKNIESERIKYLAEKINNDNQQLILKKLGNSFFGSYGCPSVFNWSSLLSAEKTTCVGRMMLRSMIYYFSNISRFCDGDKSYDYKPIVGDSVTGDTPLFIKYNGGVYNGKIDIKPISEMIYENCVEKDSFGREYDYSIKPYQVLCRSGWCDIKYVYRHETNKTIYRVENNDLCVDVTEDHSLFNENKKEIKPIEIKDDTKFEMNTNDIYNDFNNISYNNDTEKVDFNILARMFKIKSIDRVPLIHLNGTIEVKKQFLDIVGDRITLENGYSKTAVAGVNYIKKCVNQSMN